MINITPVRTRRLSVRMRELAIGDAIELLALHPERHQAATTEFLRMAISEVAKPGPGYVTDPLAMTFQERTFLVCHYLATVSEEGNFAVGDTAHYSNYLMVGRDYPAESPLHIGRIADADWTLHPLLGAHGEAIERLQMEKPLKARFHWVAGAMAAQLRKREDNAPDPVTSHAEFLDWLRSRMAWIAKLAESDFAELLAAHSTGNRMQAHFFAIDFDREGVLCTGVVPDSLGAEVPPARFQPSSCASAVAVGLSGKLDLVSG